MRVGGGDPIDDVSGVLDVERMHTAYEFVEDIAVSEEVAELVGIKAPELLGGHVGNGSEEKTFLRAAGRIPAAGNAEIHDCHRTVR